MKFINMLLIGLLSALIVLAGCSKPLAGQAINFGGETYSTEGCPQGEWWYELSDGTLLGEGRGGIVGCTTYNPQGQDGAENPWCGTGLVEKDGKQVYVSGGEWKWCEKEVSADEAEMSESSAEESRATGRAASRGGSSEEEMSADEVPEGEGYGGNPEEAEFGAERKIVGKTITVTITGAGYDVFTIQETLSDGVTITQPVPKNCAVINTQVVCDSEGEKIQYTVQGKGTVKGVIAGASSKSNQKSQKKITGDTIIDAGLPCTDSDGGKDFLVKGKVEVNGEVKEDYCHTFNDGSVYLFESICGSEAFGNDPQYYVQKKCEEGSGQQGMEVGAYQCVEGKCVGKPTVAKPCIESVNACLNEKTSFTKTADSCEGTFSEGTCNCIGKCVDGKCDTQGASSCGGGGSSSSSSGGGSTATPVSYTNSWKVESANNKLELANNNVTANNINGEGVEEIAPVVGKKEISELGDGTFSTNEAPYTYKQYLIFNTLPGITRSRIVKYSENDNDELGDHFFIKSGEQIAKYLLEFENPAKSDVKGTVLEDFKDVELILFGKKYTIMQATRPATNQKNSVQLSLMAGAEKMELRDDDITDQKGAYNVVINAENIDGTEVIIKGTDDTQKVKLSSLEINMLAQDDYFVGAGQKLSEVITAAADEKEVLFTNNWDFEYKGLAEQKTHEIGLKQNGGAQAYGLQLYDGDGKQILIPVASTKFAGKSIGVGDGTSLFVVDEAAQIKKGDYFIVTGGSPAQGSAKSYLLQYKGADTTLKTAPRILFKNMGSGETLEYSVNTENIKPGNVATIKLGGYSFVVQSVQETNVNDYKIKIDLSGDGIINQEKAIISMVDSYGSTWWLVDQNEKIVLTQTTPNPNDYDNLAPSDIVITISAVDKEVRAKLEGPIAPNVGMVLVTPEGKPTVAYGYTSRGTFVTYTEPVGKPQEVTLQYPEKQRLPQLYIVSGKK